MVNNVNGVFYATTYHPIQAGSIDGTDVTAHDNGVFRALLGSATGLYDPLGDPKAEGDPYCSLFVGRLSAQTDENSLRQAMSKFGRVKNLRLVRHIVTGASCGYAFVEFETEKDMRVAYEEAHLSKLDGASILVDYNRQQLMSGWIPRRLGGGLGGKKESGQLRFGGRDRPFRAPLRPIPHEELRKLGIPLPPEGRYMTRFQVPPPPQRRHDTTIENDGSSKIVKDKDAFEAEEARERDRHRRRRRDELSDRDYHETESRSHRKHRSDRELSKYEGHHKVEDSGDEEERHGKRKRRKDQSVEYDEDDRNRHRSERRNHTEYNDPDPEQSHGRHRYRSESDDRHLSRESEKKHHRHKHRHRDREDGSPSREGYEGKHHRSSRKHHKSTGDEKERKKSKHRERDNS